MDATLRKAAILIDSLDSESANSLLERFSADESASILQARVHLRDVADNERARVIREFYAASSGELDPARETLDQSTIALQLLPLETPDELLCQPVGEATADGGAFKFLDDTDAHTLAQHLEGEASSKIALVLCHLAPGRAAEVLKHLSASKQIDVVFRMSTIDDLSPATVNDVERSLREVLQTRDRGPGFDAVLSIIEAVDTSARVELIEQLQVQHRELATQLADTIQCEPATDDVQERADADEFDFEDLVQIDSKSLATLIQEAEPQEILLALTGASSWMVTRLLAQLPARDEKALRQRMDQCGPLALQDIAVAQGKLVQLAARLAAEGRITRPPRRPFTSVA